MYFWPTTQLPAARQAANELMSTWQGVEHGACHLCMSFVATATADQVQTNNTHLNPTLHIVFCCCSCSCRVEKARLAPTRSSMGCMQSYMKTDADLEELYSLDKCIGQGVEGEVYLATCKDTGEQAAIKLVARWAVISLLCFDNVLALASVYIMQLCSIRSAARPGMEPQPNASAAGCNAKV